jgi:ABC-type bacteriocin/lantibiotic exporter with double-glycine peptidase domain
MASQEHGKKPKQISSADTKQRLHNLPDFRHQIIAYFRHLALHTGNVVDTARIYRFFHVTEQSVEHLFVEFAQLAQENGFRMRPGHLTQAEFQASSLVHSVVRRGDEIFVIRHQSGNALDMQSLASGGIFSTSISDLFHQATTLPVLIYDGMVTSYYAESGHASTGHSQGDHHGHDDHHGHGGDTITQKLFRLLSHEKRDIKVLIGYSIIYGIFSLIVPLSSSAIVNAVQFGIVTSQLIVLVIGVGIGIGILGIFYVMENYVVEILQRRLFVKTALEIAYRLPRIQTASLQDEYAPELVNRFFDVMTIQKSLSKLLVDGISAVLVAVIGLVLLAFYDIVFLVFDLVILLFVGIVIFVLSKDGLNTSVKESKKKYATAHFLEDIARCHTSFKLYSNDEYVFQRIDQHTTQYVKARTKHFAVLMRQYIGSMLFKVFAVSSVFALGGSLVIDGQISIGQLVAAEVVILSLLSSLDKIFSQFDDFFDLLTAIDKISHITDKPLETTDGDPYISPAGQAAEVTIQDLHFSYPNGAHVLNGVSCFIPQGSRVSIVGQSGSGKSTLASVLTRIYDPSSGVVFVNGHDTRQMRLRDIRRNMAVALHHDQIFEGTVEENITMGRTISYEQIIWAMRLTELYNDVVTMPEGLQTMVSSAGENLAASMVRRIMLARAIVSRPPVLIIDKAIYGFEEHLEQAILANIYRESCWTIIAIPFNDAQLRYSDYIIVMEHGRVVEQGAPQTLAANGSSTLTTLFPLANTLFGTSLAPRA